MEQLKATFEAALLSMGISYPPTIEQISDIAQFGRVQSQNASKNARLLNEITAEYKKIIKKYCRPGHYHLDPSFGNDSNHHPDEEVIVSVVIADDTAIVKTERTKDLGFMKHISDYEFYLSHEKGRWNFVTFEKERWYLEQVYYVNEEGRYESL